MKASTKEPMEPMEPMERTEAPTKAVRARTGKSGRRAAGTRTLGLYLHVPFCRSKCNYCDFCSVTWGDEEMQAAYADRLCRDLTERAEACRAYTVDTVYFGGGTPSILPARTLLRILETVRTHYRLSRDAEITLECNPATGSYVEFRTLCREGFNRLSMGIQSGYENELRALGRIHSFSDAWRTWQAVRDAGFAHLSVDVMQGIPEQTPETYIGTLKSVLSLSPNHVSAYGLSIEKGTPFYRRRDLLPLPDEEASREMYFAGIEMLGKKGLLQYEISNFAREGHQSRHNLKYWRCEDYLGFGPAAYSCFEGVRFGNSRDVAAYLAGEDVTAEREVLTERDRMLEYVMLGLRLSEGISSAAFAARFGQELEGTYGERLSRYLASGHVRRTQDGYALTPEGMYVSNTILSDVLDL